LNYSNYNYVERQTVARMLKLFAASSSNV